MDTAVYAAAIALLAAGVSGLVTWAVARRAKSGKVNTTEAATLWTEGTAMRHELRAQVTALEAQIAVLTSSIVSLNASIDFSRHETEASRSETESARSETRMSRAETRILMEQLDALRVEVKTNNSLTIAQLADNQETRRILLVPKAERTPVEFEHLSTVNERQPPEDHPLVEDSDLEDGDEVGR